MSNDPRDLDGLKLKLALLTLGRDEKLRGELIAWLKGIEGQICYGAAVRDDITGPIIDALHTDEDLYEKTLADGTKFQFLYRTKIARDFLLAQKEYPSHVWEPQTTRLLKHMAAYTDGDILIGGAYFGDHAVLLGRQLMGSGRHVHCFEPNKAQSGMLKKNADINQLNNLILQRKGLWNQSSLRLRLDGFDSFANVVLADGSEDSFETISVDDYCAAMSRNLGVVMLDIEGAELFALQGAANTIAKDKPAIVFELHRDYVDWSDGLINTPIVAFLAQSGYEVFAVRDFNGNQEMHDLCIELVPVDTVYLEGPPHGFNMLAVPNGKLIEDPMFRVVRHVSPKLLRHKDPALHHPLDGLPI